MAQASRRGCDEVLLSDATKECEDGRSQRCRDQAPDDDSCQGDDGGFTQHEAADLASGGTDEPE